MTVTSSAVAREIRQTLSALMEFGIASYTNQVAESGSRVTWHSYGTAEDFLLSRDDLTVKGYLHWLENGHYSAILADGGLLQLSYDFDGARISGHRLAYVPCPVGLSDRVSRELIDEGWPWGEVVRAKLVALEDVQMKSAIRFDYDPANATVDHPESHFTMNTVDCRIACTRHIDSIHTCEASPRQVGLRRPSSMSNALACIWLGRPDLNQHSRLTDRLPRPR